MEQKHTKGEWKVDENAIYCDDGSTFIANAEGSRNGEDMLGEECTANARRICLCVNSHDALLTMCKEIDEIIAYDGQLTDEAIVVIKDLKQAIASAEKQGA